MNQNEINEAIEDYVRSQISINEDQEVLIDMKAGRGENGNSAIIDIRKAADKPKKAAKPVTRAAKAPTKPTVVKDEEPEEAQDVTADESPDESPEPDVDTGVADDEGEKQEQTQAPDETPDEKPAPARGSIFSKVS